MTVILNSDTINQLKELMEDKFHDLVQTYLQNCEKYILVMVEAVQQGDTQAITDAAHPLKSSSGNMGLEQLSEICANIEAASKELVQSGQSPESLSGNIEGARTAFEAGKAALLENI